MKRPIRILIIDDSESDARLLVEELKYSGYDPEFVRVDTKEEVIKAFKNFTWDIVLCDYHMPTMSGLDVLEIYKQSGIQAPFIMSSGSIGDDLAVDIVKKGAHDYVLKGNLKRLSGAIEREIRQFKERQEMSENNSKNSDHTLVEEVKKWAIEEITKLKKANLEIMKENDELKRKLLKLTQNVP